MFRKAIPLQLCNFLCKCKLETLSVQDQCPIFLDNFFKITMKNCKIMTK